MALSIITPTDRPALQHEHASLAGRQSDFCHGVPHLSRKELQGSESWDDMSSSS